MQKIEPAVRGEIADRINVAPVFFAPIGNKGADALGAHVRTSVNPDFHDQFPVLAAANDVISEVGFLQLALAGRIETNAIEYGVDNRLHLGRIKLGKSSLYASVRVRSEHPGHFFHDSIMWIDRVSAGAGVHHVGVKNDAGNERLAASANDACGIAQEPKRQADVPVAVIDPDVGVFGSEDAQQATFDRHTDLAGCAARGESIDLFVMVKIDVSP